ncbi:hypothetical protein JRQ81_006505 [Phrynocephalus forsythii]|uniref:Uncharacterized protein n=1 Tax=Phrynocephalus forsythii TaxID=171643 RepID=A0A9Q1AV14_9SAUR|nr:hypothetical protein JRQ81_006505 [Phrynocephalus forsythii]
MIPPSTNHPAMGVVLPQKHLPPSEPHLLREQHNSGPLQPLSLRQPQMVPVDSSIPQAMLPMEHTTHRPICNKTQRQMQNILFQSRSGPLLSAVKNMEAWAGSRAFSQQNLRGPSFRAVFAS